jgi:hypothetical protein
MTNVMNQPILTPLVGARIGAEVTSAIGAGIVANGFKHLLSLPHDIAVRFISRQIVLPRLDAIEAAMDGYFPGLVTHKDKRDRFTIRPSVRADELATAILGQGADFIGGLVGQVYGQKFFDQMFKVPTITDAQQFKVAGIDRACYIGSFILLNTIGTKSNLALQERLKNMYMKLLSPWGMTEDKAESMAKQTVNERIPNIMGMIGSLAVHYKFSRR